MPPISKSDWLNFSYLYCDGSSLIQEAPLSPCSSSHGPLSPFTCKRKLCTFCISEWMQFRDYSRSDLYPKGPRPKSHYVYYVLRRSSHTHSLQEKRENLALSVCISLDLPPVQCAYSRRVKVYPFMMPKSLIFHLLLSSS